jgi:hypothetical protein
MDVPHQQIFEAALSLPQPQRAELAFRLLLSLRTPGELVDSKMFGKVLQERVESYHQGTTASLSLDEARADMRKRLHEGAAPKQG